VIDETPVDEEYEIEVYLGVRSKPPAPPEKRRKRGEPRECGPINLKQLQFVSELILLVGDIQTAYPAMTNAEISALIIRERRQDPELFNRRRAERDVEAAQRKWQFKLDADDWLRGRRDGMQGEPLDRREAATENLSYLSGFIEGKAKAIAQNLPSARQGKLVL